jgi:hypothetical protein
MAALYKMYLDSYRGWSPGTTHVEESIACALGVMYSRRDKHRGAVLLPEDLVARVDQALPKAPLARLACIRGSYEKAKAEPSDG